VPAKSLGNLGSAVPEIIAYLIIQAAKIGEREPARLYGQVLKAFRIEDMSIPVVSAAISPSQPMLRSRKQRDLKRVRLAPAGLLPSFSGAYSNCRPLGI
jgi:hypothetical protein